MEEDEDEPDVDQDRYPDRQPDGPSPGDDPPASLSQVSDEEIKGRLARLRASLALMDESKGADKLMQDRINYLKRRLAEPVEPARSEPPEPKPGPPAGIDIDSCFSQSWQGQPQRT